MKKKLSILATLALCVTIGGVYATWIYATGGVATAYGTTGVTLTGTSNGGVAGTLVVEGSNTDLEVDDRQDDAYIHKAVLKYNEAGSFTITFKPSENAEADVKDGMNIQWYLGVYDVAEKKSIADTAWTYQYEDEEALQIFEINEDPTTVKVDEQNPNGDGSFSFTVSMVDVMAKIKLADNLFLDTVEEYNAFKIVLAQCEIHLHAKVVENT